MRYQPANYDLLGRLFDLVEREDPRQDDEETLTKIEVLFAPLGFQVDAAKISKCINLRAIISNTTGIPHIDIDAANSRGISVCALHNEQAFLDTITPTAEHAIGLMLAAWRRIPFAHEAASAGNWDRRPWGAPRMLSRMSIGVLGMGRLGKRVAHIAHAMGMKVRWFDPYVPGGELTLIDLVRVSDVLSLHLPANAETVGIVSRSILEALPTGALVVNTARGELLDTEALLDLLECGHLGAAALDTIAGEYAPDFSTHFAASRMAAYARSHDNLVLTPHIGGSTIDAWLETERYAILKACRALGLGEELWTI